MAFNENSYNLVQVSEVKTFLGISVTTYDQILTDIVNGATDWIEAYCGGRRFGNTTAVPTYTQETYDSDSMPSESGEKQNWLYLDNFPVTAFTTIEYRTGTSTYATFDSTAYETYGDRGGIYFYGGMPKGKKSVRVTYNAGYLIAWSPQSTHTLPNDLTLACKLLASQIFNKRKSQGIKSESIGSWSLSYDTPEDEGVSKQITNILARYRRAFV